MEELTKEENHNEPVAERMNKRQRVQQLERRVDRLIGMINETKILRT